MLDITFKIVTDIGLYVKQNINITLNLLIQNTESGRSSYLFIKQVITC